MATKEMEPLNKYFKLFLIINIVVTALAIPAGIYDFLFYIQLDSAQRTSEQIYPADIVTGIFGLLQFLIFAVVAILFLCWIYRINMNLHILSPMKMKYSPGWAVGWYFVPLMNLFEPYRATKEIWTASHKGTDGSPELLKVWWFFWITSNVVGRLAFRMDDRVVASSVYLIGDGIDLVLNIIALLMIVRISKAYSRNFGMKGYGAQTSRPHYGPQASRLHLGVES